MKAVWSKEIFARNLKSYMELTGKGRNRVADDLNIPYSTLTEWLNAKKYPRIDKIEMLADYFGIMKSDLIEDKGEIKFDKKNDTLSSVTFRLMHDNEFLEVVTMIKDVDSEKLTDIKTLLKAFLK